MSSEGFVDCIPLLEDSDLLGSGSPGVRSAQARMVTEVRRGAAPTTVVAVSRPPILTTIENRGVFVTIIDTLNLTVQLDAIGVG